MKALKDKLKEAKNKIKYFILDNALNNNTYIEALGKKLRFN